VPKNGAIKVTFLGVTTLLFDDMEGTCDEDEAGP
jgi:hypothetical protein